MSRKYKKSRKFNYNQGSNVKKIVLIVLAIVLVAAAVLVAINFFGKKDDNTRDPSLTLQTAPNKLTYYVGDVPSWYGLKVKYISPENNSFTLGPESCTITGFDSSAPADNQVITVTYKEYSVTFNISILEKTENNQQQGEPDGLFVGMTFKTKPKTQYKVGDWINVKDGVLLLKYNNGTTKEMAMTYDMVSGFTTAKPGTYTVTVIYMEDGHRAKLTYDITVTE